MPRVVPLTEATSTQITIMVLLQTTAVYRMFYLAGGKLRAATIVQATLHQVTLLGAYNCPGEVLSTVNVLQRALASLHYQFLPPTRGERDICASFWPCGSRMSLSYACPQ